MEKLPPYADENRVPAVYRPSPAVPWVNSSEFSLRASVGSRIARSGASRWAQESAAAFPSVGAAESTTLVLQTVLPALLAASGPSRLVLEGGTHNPMAPPFDFLARSYLPLVSRMGPNVTVELERYGFHPAGGGRIVAQIEPTERLDGIELIERGTTKSVRAVAVVANLPDHVARREFQFVRRRLGWPESSCDLVEVENSRGPGNVLMLEVESENVTEVFTAFGEVARPAESVAKHAVNEYQRYRKSTAVAAEFLTEQILLPLAIAGGGSVSSMGLSPQAKTQIDLIEKFLNARVRAESADGAQHVHVET